ncbi:signal recognition particle 9 kDa protein-domain-containing protein [Xylaria telfairii]|nr:signal recognition particle 9 kDa protein-domain-containing protein [Xylaria telfairii]
MPYYETSQEWLRQSALLLEARPSTTRITTTYHLTDKTGTSKKRQKRRQQESSTTTTTTSPPSTTPTPRASLTLKTYDPNSGTCLKYRTTKAAEVSRLILSLGQLGRRMAALPLPADADAVMVDAGADEVGTPSVEKTEGSGGATKGQVQQTPAQGQQQQAGGGGGGGKGKKKRGKK